jgi:hypothetical protein
MYGGEEFNRVPDMKVQIGTVTEGGIPSLKEPIKGMTLDFELDITQVKKFMKIKSKKTWTFSP